MGCSPTKNQHKDADVKDTHNDTYLQPDLDIEAYHFHHYVKDMIGSSETRTGDDGAVNKFLNILFKEWPIPDPNKFKTVKRYGRTYETWPQNHSELLDTIDRTEQKLINNILGEKLRPVSAYLKGAATMKELVGESEAKPDEV
jgi:hypothetical protein